MTDHNPNRNTSSNASQNEPHQHKRLRDARISLSLEQQILETKERFKREATAYEQARKAGQPTGLSPLEQLKLQALAPLFVLAQYHCICSHIAAEQGDVGASHVWALDEGRLQLLVGTLIEIDVSVEGLVVTDLDGDCSSSCDDEDSDAD